MAHAVVPLVADPASRPAGWTRKRTIRTEPRILIVDDEPLVLDFVERVLREAGYSTARAIDGQDALEFAKRAGPFDLLLTDVVMPRMSGTDLAQRLRLADPDLKVLYVTGYVDRLFQEKDPLWCDEAFLEKPTSVDGLLEAVTMLLNERGLRKPTDRSRRQ